MKGTQNRIVIEMMMAARPRPVCAIRETTSSACADHVDFPTYKDVSSRREKYRRIVDPSNANSLVNLLSLNSSITATSYSMVDRHKGLQNRLGANQEQIRSLEAADNPKD